MLLIFLIGLPNTLGAGLSLVCCLVLRGSTGGFHLLQDFIGVVSQPRGLRESQYVVYVKSSSLTHHRPYSSFVCFPMGNKTFMPTSCLELLQKLRARVRIQ